ncbi:type IV pilus assembly protein PilM [Candidatus Pacebacteria bacterium]|nr:type IV pilus assembly protein PilM [Candidatus Paceibacterota bacterium]
MALTFKKFFSSLSQSAAGGPSRVVGIDVGSASLKVVELEQTEKAITLRTYGELQLGPYAEKDLGEVVSLEPQKLTEALVDVIRESTVKAKNGVLAIPLNSSFVTVVPIKTSSSEEVDAKVKLEARKYIPVPLSDVMLDWSLLNEYGDKEEHINEVLLAAIQNDAFERYVKLMASIEMPSQPSEIEVFSAIRGVHQPTDETLAIIDLGAETSKLYITKDGALQRIHRVYEGGVTGTKRIAQALNISFAEAEDLKRSYTPEISNAREIFKAYITTVDRSVQEFKRVIEQYEARIEGQVDRVVMIGGGAQFQGVSRHVADLLARDVEFGKPFERVAYPAFMEDVLTEAGTSFATALGAALRPFETPVE